jgi:hypothetical protein
MPYHTAIAGHRTEEETMSDGERASILGDTAARSLGIAPWSRRARQDDE